MPGLSSGSSEEGHDPVWERIVWVLSRLQRAGYSRLVRPGFTDRTSSVVLAEAALLRALDQPFDPPVWDEPHQRHQQVDPACDPRIDERE